MQAALTWRLHCRDGRPAVAEVLFIATWEEERGARMGSVMVEALEALARKHGCKYLYVEVGHEQPLAAQFWSRKHGFKIVSAPNTAFAAEISPQTPGGDVKLGHLLANISRTCVPLLWHQFFAVKCLRFGDTQQFVKQLC